MGQIIGTAINLPQTTMQSLAPYIGRPGIRDVGDYLIAALDFCLTQHGLEALDRAKTRSKKMGIEVIKDDQGCRTLTHQFVLTFSDADQTRINALALKNMGLTVLVERALSKYASHLQQGDEARRPAAVRDGLRHFDCS